MQGLPVSAAAAISKGDVENADISTAERELLIFAELVTRRANQTTAGDVQKLRNAGWSDEEIAEAVYVIAMFAFFNRVADAFGLQDPGFGQVSPAETDSDGESP